MLSYNNALLYNTIIYYTIKTVKDTLPGIYPFLWHRACPSMAPWAHNANSSNLAGGMQPVPPAPQLLHCKEGSVDNDLPRIYLRSFLYVF